MRFIETYKKSIMPTLAKDLGIKNIHALPYVERVVVNVGLGRMSQKPSFSDKILPEIIEQVASICGQRPSNRAAKKSIAGFKLREGQVIGLAATLRGARMYDLIEKIVGIAYPRVRDFRGISLKNIDKAGNLNLGFRDQVVFPEINMDTSSVDFGLQITLVCKAKSREDAIELYKKLGFRFKK